MGFQELFLVVLVVGAASAQNFKVCGTTSLPSSLCQSIGKDDSQASCEIVESRLDCAVRLARGAADIGYFTEEETLLLTQQQPNDIQVIGSVRDINKLDPYSFETVAVVPSNLTNGFEGLRGGVYCHPGLDQTELRWSPRVLKTLEELVARTDRCPDTETAGKTADELEIDTLSKFFSAACRPGVWSNNATVDADLKSRYPSLCSLCGPDSGCSQYTINMGVSIAGVRNENRHIQALECLRTNSDKAAVAYVAWQHAKEYFTIRNPGDSNSYSILCPNGSLVALNDGVLNSATSPCAFVRQPWGALVASTASATNLLTNLKTWWATGSDPGANTWQSIMYQVLIPITNTRVVFQDSPISISNYTNPIRTISNVDSTASCLPARRWCTLSTAEQAKCSWVRSAAYTLGIQPPISCQQRASQLECLSDIRDNRADFVSLPSNYGYLARQHYRLTPVKLVQNSQSAASRIAAFVKPSAATTGNITRFENLRGKKACFPEFSGLAYMSFVRVGQDRGILSDTECDYAKAVGEFFDGACAPGAIDASHALSNTSSFDSSVLCSVCQPRIPALGNFSNNICSYDYSNKFFGNNGSLACLIETDADIAVLNIANIASNIKALGYQENQFRALCRNNSLAQEPGINIDDGCLLSYVVDAEVVTRRNDPLFNSLNVLLDSLGNYFGYTAASGNQLINLEIFSPFDGVSDLLFKDSTIGLTEPTSRSSHEPARNYIDLVRHLQACTGTAPPIPGLASRSLFSIITLITMALLTRFVIY
ncbi:transferrin-like [Trichoplusia ni]|uniref:Transferrin-like n=1 Tax=Trichoplusia ni TaxID=7111 RepID=A0A7E5VB15_TRINI|nr:transferrin-like [Trichoplusia ni]